MAKHKTRIHRCSQCNRPATWLYMPGSQGQVFFCNDHVPVGCGCNNHDIEMDGEPDIDRGDVVWWPKDTQNFDLLDKERKPDSYHYQYLMENGRLFPCCEYDYDPEGHEFLEDITIIPTVNVRKVLSQVTKKSKCWTENECTLFRETFIEILSNSENRDSFTNYNQLMTNVAMFVDKTQIPYYRIVFDRMKKLLIPFRQTVYTFDWEKKKLNQK